VRSPQLERRIVAPVGFFYFGYPEPILPFKISSLGWVEVPVDPRLLFSSMTRHQALATASTAVPSVPLSTSFPDPVALFPRPSRQRHRPHKASLPCPFFSFYNPPCMADAYLWAMVFLNCIRVPHPSSPAFFTIHFSPGGVTSPSNLPPTFSLKDRQNPPRSTPCPDFLHVLRLFAAFSKPRLSCRFSNQILWTARTPSKPPSTKAFVFQAPPSLQPPSPDGRLTNY